LSEAESNNEQLSKPNAQILMEINSVISRCKDDNRPFARVNIFDTELRGLLDSGSNCSVLGKKGASFLEKFKLRPFKICERIKTADGTHHDITGKIDLPIEFNKKIQVVTVYVVPSLERDLILGMDFWNSFNIQPIMCEEISFQTIDQDENMIELNSQQKSQLFETIKKLPEAQEDKIGLTSLLEHHIDTGSNKPVTQRPYLVSPHTQEKIYNELDRLLKLGIVEESNSDWSNPLVVVQKANKSTRLCIDARKLNEVTIKDEYPLPNINRILAQLRTSKFLSSIDLKDAFFQIPLSLESRHKTAFAVPGRGFFHFRRCPFGLSNSPKTMSRLMDKILGCRLEPNVFTYLDDVIIATPNFETHIRCLETIAESFKEAGITINTQKSKFCRKQLEYLGYIIDSELGLRTDPEKVGPILRYPTPTKVKEVQRFLGMVGWYQRFIKNFANLTAPISDLTSKTFKKKFEWTPKAEEAFRNLKSALVTDAILIFPDYSKPFRVHTDASDLAAGAVLTQYKDELERPVVFYSKKFNSAQKNYSTTERECLAVVWAVEKFRPYLEGRPFEVITDHASLKQMNSFKNQNSRLFKMSMRLQGYDYRVIPRKGVDNVVPDALSRAIEEIELTSSHFVTDKWYQNLKEKIMKDPTAFPKYHYDDKFLYHILPENKRTLVIPSALRPKLLEENHDEATAGHQGVFKTLRRLKSKYYWPTMSKDAKRYVANCEVCKASKAVHQTMRPPIGPQKQADNCWQTVSVDLIGPITCSKNGHVYILSVVDNFSKFPLIFPLKNATAKPIIHYLETFVFTLFNVPKILISDNGKQLVGKEFKKFLSKYNVIHHTTPYYHPQANPVERVNKVIGETIRCYVNESQDRWDENLAQIGAAMRSSVHCSTGYSPYFLNFGREMVLDGKTYEVSNLLDHQDRNEELEKLNLIREKAKENLKKAYAKYASSYNLRTRCRQFNVGDTVWRKNYCLSNASDKFCAKLAPKYVKAIVKKRNGNVYELQNENGKLVGTYQIKDLVQDIPDR
jgi:RNase H-like domain found in reverse transcriptase/Reverse transcriptase (RNA-dependent DNA polymerase)/Integrase zinc binding domain/Integrase core domain/Aspartyl protease